MKDYLSLSIVLLRWSIVSFSKSDTYFRRLWDFVLLYHYVSHVIYDISLLLAVLNDKETHSRVMSALILSANLFIASFIIILYRQEQNILNVAHQLNNSCSLLEEKLAFPQTLSVVKTERYNKVIVKLLHALSVTLASLISLEPVFESLLTQNITISSIHKPGGTHSSRFWFPFDVSNGIFVYLTFSLEWTLLGVGVFFFYGSAGLAFSLANHMVTKFKILQFQIRHARKLCVLKLEGKLNGDTSIEELLGGRDTGNRVQHQDLVDEMFNHLRQFIIYHQEILCLSNKISKILSPFLLNVIGSVLVLISILIFLTSLSPTNSSMFHELVACIILVSGNLLVTSWYCSEISKQSGLVVDAVIESDWIDCPKKYKTSLLIVLARANKELVISAGGFAKIDMDTYIKTMQAAFSYYTVMSSLK